ncbi:MAG: T9SS type A sorting domain-containing protein [Candidatus Marinimicrobia bacterium]|nr:T9SS type A sorting domain-containing protein [Candidatus Neomarinimicrobiota bacterium]
MPKLKTIFGILTVFLLYGNGGAITRITVGSLTATPGETKIVPVIMSTAATVAAMQFIVPQLPDMLELTDIQFDQQLSALNTWNLFSNKVYNGTYKLLGFDEALTGITGENLKIARLSVYISDDVRQGIYPITLDKPVLTNQYGEVLLASIQTGYLTISDNDVVIDLQNDTIGLYDASTQLAVLVSTVSPVAGFQFDLVDSADIFRGVECRNPFGNGWDVYCEELTSGVTRILVSSASGSLIPDSSQFKLPVFIAANTGIRSGQYPVTIENIVVSDEHAGRLSGVGNSTQIQVDSLLPASFDLLLPENYYITSAYEWETQHVWQRSFYPPIDSAIIYDLKLQVNGSDSPIVNYYTGLDTSVVLNFLDLYTLLDSLGFYPFTVEDIQWWVMARTDQRTRRSESVYNLNISNFVAVKNEVAVVPVKHELLQNYPNPFNSRTVLSFDISRETDVTLTVYNVLGQEIRTLSDRPYTPGHYRISWNGKNNYGEELESGIYFVLFLAGDYRQTRKLVFLK